MKAERAYPRFTITAKGTRWVEGGHPWIYAQEIVSLMGTVSEHGSHLHASLAHRDLSVFGGHLRPGCLVNTTAEIVLAELPDTVFTRERDEATGYEELAIRRIDRQF